MPRRKHFSARPLAWFALSAGVGIITADNTAPVVPAYAWFGAAAVVAIAALRFRGPAVFLLLTALVFATRHAATLDNTRFCPLRVALENRSSPMDSVIEGRVIKPLRRDLPGTEPGAALFVASRITAPYDEKNWTGPATLRLVPDQKSDLAPGSYRVTGRLRIPAAPDNPGQHDKRTQDLRRGLVADLRAREITLIKEDRWSLAAALDHGAERCREWVKRTLAQGIGDDADAHTIVLATLLGGAESGAGELEEPFRVTGTLHIFAVSGLHVGIVGWILWSLLKPLGLKRGTLALVVSVALFGYAFLTGLRPSTVRAAVMAVVFLSGELWRRKPDMLNSLGTAALILLVNDTNQIFSIGFQLSFAVITTIALLHGRFVQWQRRWTEQDGFLPEALLGTMQRTARDVRRKLATSLSISTASWIGSLPFTIRHFHLATPVALLANVFLVPIAFFILFTAILTFVTTLVHLAPVAAVLGNANWFFARSAMVGAQWFALIPGGNFYLDIPSLIHRPSAQLTVLRLRGGAAAQHLHAGGHDWLFDCGGAKGYDFLQRAYLHAAAVNKLDGLVLSHADSEHIGAAPLVMRDVAPRQVFLSSAERDSRSKSLKDISAAGIKPSLLTAGDIIEISREKNFPVIATTLFPPSGHRAAHADDRALVLRLDAGPFRILWMNDAGFVAEKYLLAHQTRDALRCDVLIRNQNTGDITLADDFLDAVRPRVLISSNNNFPDGQKIPQRIRDLCESRGISLMDQAEAGAVTLKFFNDHLEALPFHPASGIISLGNR